MVGYLKLLRRVLVLLSLRYSPRSGHPSICLSFKPFCGLGIIFFMYKSWYRACSTSLSTDEPLFHLGHLCSGHSLLAMVLGLLNLGLLLCLAPWTLASRLSDGRTHGNVPPKSGVPRVHLEPDLPVVSKNGTKLPPYNTTYFFDQLIDHNNPSLGTFTQRYWHSYEFYEPGGPIVLNTPGEENAFGEHYESIMGPMSFVTYEFIGYVGYVTNRTISGLIAQQQNGAAVVLEHRFYGYSNPRPNLNDSSLELLTIQQAIEDLAYFAKNVKLPMPNGDQLGPDKAPWILVGGSYSGM